MMPAVKINAASLDEAKKLKNLELLAKIECLTDRSVGQSVFFLIFFPSLQSVSLFFASQN